MLCLALFVLGGLRPPAARESRVCQMRSFRKTAKASLEPLRSCVTGEAAALGAETHERLAQALDTCYRQHLLGGTVDTLLL